MSGNRFEYVALFHVSGGGRGIDPDDVRHALEDAFADINEVYVDDEDGTEFEYAVDLRSVEEVAT